MKETNWQNTVCTRRPTQWMDSCFVSARLLKTLQQKPYRSNDELNQLIPNFMFSSTMALRLTQPLTETSTKNNS